MKVAKKVLLVILDGWGLSPNKVGNAPLLAKTPNLDYIYSAFPKTSLAASGLEVGLSPGEPGNSEVGHMNIGLGRVVWENLPKIDQLIASGSFFDNAELNEIYDYIKDNGQTLHLIGLVSDGGVHSHIRHLIAMLEMAKKKGVKNVLIHFITDGRDTPPTKAIEFVRQLQASLDFFKFGRIATIIGRYFAMDRDTNWKREMAAYDLFTKNTGTKFATADEAVLASYKEDKTDEFIEAAVIGEGGMVMPGDAVIFYNHRSDRMRQMLSLFEGGQKSVKPPAKLKLLTMTQYDKTQKTPVICPSVSLANTLSDVISVAGKKQFHTAETEKFAHVTYFFKAGNEKVLKGEKDQIVPSKKVATYDKLPEMSAKGVEEKVIGAMKSQYDFIVVNFANGDMVGHTGMVSAAIKACECVDSCLGNVLVSAAAEKYRVFITADHGNCEIMINETTGDKDKEHSTDPVPFVFLNFEEKTYAPADSQGFSEDDYIQYAVGSPIGVLADVAPSILANLDLKNPSEMSGMDLSVAMM